MKTKELIPVQQFCTSHEIEFSFINSLKEYGLIEITTVRETQYIYEEQLRDLEKMLRLHYELDINIEGIQAIVHLLGQVDNLHSELFVLRNKLRLYEEE